MINKALAGMLCQHEPTRANCPGAAEILRRKDGWSCACLFSSLSWMTFEGRSKIRAQNITLFPQSTVPVSSAETS